MPSQEREKLCGKLLCASHREQSKDDLLRTESKDKEMGSKHPNLQPRGRASQAVECKVKVAKRQGNGMYLLRAGRKS